MRVLDAIADMLSSRSRVQIVADDPHLASELLLLIRMMFADGELKEGELEYFRQLCSGTFDIPEEEISGVIRFLKQTGYETTGEQAASTFLDMPEERRFRLINHLLSMARADAVLHESEVELIARVAGVFGYTPAEVHKKL